MTDPFSVFTPGPQMVIRERFGCSECGGFDEPVSMDERCRCAEDEAEFQADPVEQSERRVA